MNFRLQLFSLAIGFAVLSFAAPAHAKLFSVTVQDRNLQPISQAQVCAGTFQRPFEYGAAFTAGQYNEANINVPDSVVSMVVTVSKNGYRGMQKTVDWPIREGEISLFTGVILEEGSGGPTCNLKTLPPTVANPIPPLRLNTFQINGGQTHTSDRVVTLDVTYVGGPTHYQVSESPEFSGATWKQITGVQLTYNFDATSYNLPGTVSSVTTRSSSPSGARPVRMANRPPSYKYGDRTLYFRLRNASTTTEEKHDNISLGPKAMKDYEVTGELSTLLNSAHDEFGFRFSTRVIESNMTGGCGGKTEQDKVDFDLPGVRIAAAHTGFKTVEYTLFAGRRLNPFWELKEMKFGAIDETLAANLNESSLAISRSSMLTADAERRVTFKFIAATGLVSDRHTCFDGFVKLVSIKLRGPEGMDWRDAFR
jgi:hypothetical protein